MVKPWAASEQCAEVVHPEETVLYTGIARFKNKETVLKLNTTLRDLYVHLQQKSYPCSALIEES